ncbi:Xanthine and CO dehydrogenase maturation factor, XdhC/CoxF family [Hyunsoonleella jejuensis]|uniref:Xanthine and CO dehydrogenase maturation factor, XdhC/CoxF family n=1 Tax=Hyunsoonleella jejuensis TaxID=419940 RepID=A0A1H9H0L6_9FLAO|nr:XdhC/CoxI family protein [Hyunsoonleella jejuensis]SEQ55803.1 Xanthine and CO dehydrogenase maturation factor, XdhC/CoxF family [Hyunsoonleella jejuensis]
MTHEFKNIIEEAVNAKNRGLKSVLASVVDLDGSSYRRPGVRMLIMEDNTMIGAVSGGCVEKEVLLQAQSVFKTGQSKMMTYDGRYRLGCEGVLYILLEQVSLEPTFESSFFKCLNDRKPFDLISYYEKKEGVFEGAGSELKIGKDKFNISERYSKKEDSLVFRQAMPPCYKLMIIGAEHDAVQLCQYAAITGWEVAIVAGVSESKSIDNFPGAKTLIPTTPENLDVSSIDDQTAIVLMTHNFAYDLRHLVALKNTNPSYIGLLGPTKRREDLLSQFIEYCPEVSDGFLDVIHGPAGLNIGSETPQEIAISIISEILSFTRKRNPISLSKKLGSIHSKR